MRIPPPLDFDVRPLLAQGKAPLPAILNAVANLEEAQALRLIAPFDPAPLRDLLAQRGFDCLTSEDRNGVWTLVFSPRQGV